MIKRAYMTNKNPYNFPVWKVTFIKDNKEEWGTWVTEAQAMADRDSLLSKGFAAWVSGPFEDYIPFRG